MSLDSNPKRKISSLITNYDESPTDFAKNFRRLRACARCHRLKMKCTFEDPSFESCTRCFKAGLRCSVTDDPTLANAKLRPRKRTKLKGNGVLAQLQKSINESNKFFNSIQRGELLISEETNIDNLLTLQFQLSETQRLVLHTINTLKERDNNYDGNSEREANSINSMKDGIVKSVPNLPWISCESNIMKELIKLNIISTSDAKIRMEQFFTDFYVYWPCVSFPKHYTYNWMLENEPLVLLSFITVTCLNDPDLHDTLLYYLENSLSVRTSIIGNISISFIQIHLILSLWCSPPKKWGSYKHQMSLLMALNLTLCLDLGNEVYKNSSSILSDDSTERQMIRSYMAVYSCCGSLGLSLPRFKVVSWTPVHERCSQLLLLGESNQADKFLYYFSKLVAIGEEIFQFLCPNGFPNSSVAKTNLTNHENGIPQNNIKLKEVMIKYEKRMQKLATESNLFKMSSKIRNLLSIIYYQLLMTMYDYIVCKVLLRRDVLTEVYIQTLTKLIKASKKVISSFCLLCDQTNNFPTFFYYRPMHALVALIRARLLVKTQELDLEVNVEEEHDNVMRAIGKLSQNSKVASKMSTILTRISKWMKVSSKFNKNGATNSMVDLLDELGKEKAIEKIKVNLKFSKIDNGDNLNMSQESKANFNNFINYTVDNAKENAFSSNSQIPMRRGGENGTGSRASRFVPSPIGYSNSEELSNDLFSLRGKSPLLNTMVESGNVYSKPTVTCAEHVLAGNVFSVSQRESKQSGIFISNESQTQHDDDVDELKQIDGSAIRNRFIKTPSATSVVDSIQSGNNQGLTNDAGIMFQQQQQDFLDDLFSQIDTDIMNTHESTVSEGMGITPMFDFLGTGFQNSNGFGEFHTPDDWFKSL